METDFFTPEEDALIDGIKALLYSDQFNLDSLRKSFGNAAAEQRQRILEAATIQVSAEQAQRLRFILGSIVVPGALADEKRETFVDQLSLNPTELSGLATKFEVRTGGLMSDSVQDPSVLEQLKIYHQTGSNINTLFVELLRKEWVAPFLPLLDSLSGDQLANLTGLLSQFLTDLQGGRAENPDFDPSLSTPIVQILQAANMQTALDSFNDFTRKIDFIKSLLYVAQGIINNRRTKAFSNNDELGRSIAELFRLEDITPNFEL